MAGQENAFLKLGSIIGKSTTTGFEKQIVLQSIQFGVNQAGEWEEGNAKSGRITTFNDLTVTKEMDESSPSLAAACAAKDQFPTAEISLVDAQNVYFKLSLENVIVANVSVGFHGTDAHPAESVSLRFKKYIEEWGTARVGYDLTKNEKC